MTQQAIESTTPSIPDLSDEKLTLLAAKMRPVMRDAKGMLRFIAPVDLRNVAFTWQPVVFRERADLVQVATIRTLHTWGYPAFFKPSIAEAQIPSGMEDVVVAFEVVGPRAVSDFYVDEETRRAFDAGFHTAKTTLYAAKGRS